MRPRVVAVQILEPPLHKPLKPADFGYLFLVRATTPFSFVEKVPESRRSVLRSTDCGVHDHVDNVQKVIYCGTTAHVEVPTVHGTRPSNGLRGGYASLCLAFIDTSAPDKGPDTPAYPHRVVRCHTPRVVLAVCSIIRLNHVLGSSRAQPRLQIK